MVSGHGTVVLCASRHGLEGCKRLLELQPYIDDAHPLLAVFPPRYYAVLVPTVVGVALASATVGFIGYVMVAATLRRQAQQH